jgi:nucleoside-diphosphate-sugar epimerase
MISRCAITGSNGFIGSLLKKTLLDAGHHAVSLERPEWSIPDDIDAIIHCAAYLPSSYNDFSEMEKCITDNAISTFKLLENAEKKGVKTFVYLSSGQIYKWKSDPKTPASEEDIVDPIERASPYLISKMTGDCLVRSHKGNIRKIVLRPSSVYGPGMKKNGLIHRLLDKIKNGEDIILENENYYIDLVHIEDVVGIIEKCLTKDVSQIYNVGGGNELTTAHLATSLSDILGTKITLSRNAKTQPGHCPLDIRKAQQNLGYKPKRAKDALKSYLESL